MIWPPPTLLPLPREPAQKEVTVIAQQKMMEIPAKESGTGERPG